MAETTIQELDRRLATLEGWKEAQEKVFLGFKDDLQDIKGRITALDQGLSGRIAALGQDLGARITAGDQELGGRITALEQKADLQFRWVVGIQLSTLLAIVAVLLGVVLRG